MARTPTTTIRTPDHRVRVFVSSTLHELAAERAVVREAIQRVRLTPVMFEAGARAHPPRDLYRAYLAQSDVFVGVYWRRYGWVAPDMTISGLEDEYVLAKDHPKLIYVKRADDREPELQALLARIGADDVAYRPFGGPEELAELVANDLVVMLSETFTARPASGSKPRVDVDERAVDVAPPSAPPAERGALLGRDAEVARILELLEGGEGFVTLTGPGGTGKTRLAIHVAHRARERFPDGVHYVPLAAVREAARVVPAILQTLEIPLPQGGGDPARVLAGALRRQQALLVLDNFEQVADAAPQVGELAAQCPDLRVVVTSQHALRVAGESEVPIPTLPTTAIGPGPSAAEALFERRAREVLPSFSISADNRADVREICRRLDGLPLAVELAASRVRVLAPKAMVGKLDSALGLLSSSAKDLPERQRTLRAALTWSHELLPEPERVLFRRLGVLSGRFGVDQATAVAGAIDGLDVLDGLAALLDKSLLVRTEALGEARFHMLETVREFAREKCVAAGDEAAARGRHGAWALVFAEEHAPHVLKGRRAHVDRFALEDAAVRAAMEACFAPGGDRELGWRIYFWYAAVAQMQMRLSDVVGLHAKYAQGGEAHDEVARARAAAVQAWAAGAAGDVEAMARLEDALPLLRAHGPREAVAWLLAVVGMNRGFLGDVARAEPVLIEATAMFEGERDHFGLAFAQSIRALCEQMTGRLDDARKRLAEAVRVAQANDSDEGASIALSAAARGELMAGDVAKARDLFADAAAFARDKRTQWGRSDALMGLSAVLTTLDEPAETEAVLEETLLCLERAGAGAGVGAGASTIATLLGPLADLLARRGETERAARVFVGVADGVEDSEEPTLAFTDALGGMRAAIRRARAAVGEQAAALRRAGLGVDEAMQAAIGASRRDEE